MKTLDELQKMADFVEEVIDDDEAAHGAEDELMVACLEAIAEGIAEPERAAAIGLSTRELEFSRWYA